MTRPIDITNTALDRGPSILALIVITCRKTDYLFEDVPLSVERREHYILIYKRQL